MDQKQVTRRRYTADEKAKAVALASHKGVVVAARELGVSKTNVSVWAKRARDSSVSVAGPVPSPAPNPTPAPATETRKKPTVAKAWTPSQKAEILEHAAAHGATATAQKFGVSRFSVYEWQCRVKLAAVGKGPSSTSGPAATDIEARRDKEILDEWHHQPGLGPSQVRNQLRRKGVKVSTHTVTRVMEEAGYRPRKVKRVPHDDRFEAVRPNQLWHLDFLHRNINKSSVFTLVILDDYSRFAVGSGVDDAERADLVIGAFEAATTQHGRPEMIIHDKGSAFWSWKGVSRFTGLLTEMGIDQIPAEDKEWNGKSEVFHS